MNHMKIGVDIRVLMDRYYSGVSEYAANLLNAIFAIDSDDEYKLFYNSFKNIDERLKGWNRVNSRVIGSHIPNKIFNYLGQKIFSFPKIDKKLGGVNVFWSPHFNFSSFKKGTKKVITVHDLSFLRYPEFFSVRKNIWHKMLGVKNILKSADKIIAVSESTKNDIIELIGIARDKIKVIYSGNNAVKKELSEEERGNFNKETCDFLFKNNLSGRLIFYLGTIEPRKNLVGLIRAYNLLRTEDATSGKNKFFDLKLVLAGANGWKNKKIYAEREISPYKNDIIFLGYINQREKEILYQASAVFVYPSYYEGFGFPPLEAMTYGLPVICSNISSLPEVVADAALTINPFEIKEISAAIDMVLNDEPLRKLLIEKGLARAQFFTWEKTAQEYLKTFKELYNE